MRSARRLLYALVAFAIPFSVHAEDWPSWRGPTGMGQSTATGVPTSWGGKERKNIVWKTPLYENDKVKRDQNQSSPIVVGDRLFITLSFWPVGSKDKDFPEHHVICYRAGDGKKQWDVKVPPGPWLLSDFRGGYTVPTPACDGKTLVVAFGSSVIAALELDGKIRWRKEITPHAFDVCIGTSPILYKDMALFLSDLSKGSKSSNLVAYDLATGDIRYKAMRPESDWTHSTPVLAKVDGKTQLLVADANGPQGLDPDTGKKLWWYKSAPRVGDTTSPLYADGVVYCDSGRGGPGVAVEPTGTDAWPASKVKWKIGNVPEAFSSPVAVGKRMFRAVNPGVLTCWDLDDGKPLFRERAERLDAAVSPIATADGFVYFAGGGRSYVLKAESKLDIVSVNDLDDPSKACAAIAGNRLYVKGGRNLYCIGAK
ncbi:MAG TPA: PQQ-binding-like beta-propeller repeat protein [Gemmataceae bacterium]|nr:PQQ-binding-like beta-propeller repeat protein [Gemmataceae bacterium]